MTKLTILHISNCFLSFFLHWPQTKKEHFIHFFLSHIHLHYSYHQFSHTSIFIKRLIFCAIVCSYLRLQTFQRISFSIQARKKTLFFSVVLFHFVICFVIKWNAMLETSWRYIRMRFSGHYLYTFIPIEWIFHRYVLLLEMKYHAFFSILIGSVQQFDVHSRFMLFSFQLKY